MTLDLETKRRSGYNPNQPRDRKGRWVETGAEVRNSITNVLGTVTRIVQGDALHPTSFEVRDSSGGTQTWQQSAVDVVRNPDGSAPTVHPPGGAAITGQVSQVYGGQAPATPQGRSPVAHAVDAVYGAPHPDQPGATAGAVRDVYAGQAPAAPAAGRPSVAHAVDAVYGAAPQAPRGGVPGVRPMPGQNYIAKPPRGVDPQRFEEVQAPQREKLGLDKRWIVGGDGRGYAPVMALKPGDTIYTHTDGTEVHLPKVPSGQTLARYQRTPRLVDWVQQQGMGYYTVHFTDGTSATPAKANFRAFAVTPWDRAGGGTPDVTRPAPTPTPPPAPDVTPPAPPAPPMPPIPAGHTLYRDSQGLLWVVDDTPMPLPADWTDPQDVAAWNARPRYSGRRLIVSTGQISRNRYQVYPDEMQRVDTSGRGAPDVTPPAPAPPAPPPAPRRFADVAAAQAHARELGPGRDNIANAKPNQLALSDGGGLIVHQQGRGQWQVLATGPMLSLGLPGSFTTKNDALGYANRVEREMPNAHWSGDDLQQQLRDREFTSMDLVRQRVAYDQERGATDATSQLFARQLEQDAQYRAEEAARQALIEQGGYAGTKPVADLQVGDEVAFRYSIGQHAGQRQGWRADDGTFVTGNVLVEATVNGTGQRMTRHGNNYNEFRDGMRYPLAGARFTAPDGRTGAVTGSPTIEWGTPVHVRPVSARPVADMTPDELAAEYNSLDPNHGAPSLTGNPNAAVIRARMDALMGEIERRDREQGLRNRQLRDDAAREAAARFDAAEQFNVGDLVTYPDPVNTYRTEVGRIERIDRTGAVVPGQVTGPDSPPPDAHLVIRNRLDGSLNENIDPRDVRPAGEAGQRQAPTVPDGPLAQPVRSALAAINDTNGISDQDLAYYGQRLSVVAEGNADREYAHSIVEETRNTIINSTDGGERQGAMNALDALDTAIDTHEDTRPPERPQSYQFRDAIIEAGAGVDLTDLTTEELDAGVARLQQLTRDWIASGGNPQDQQFVQASSVLQTLGRERDSRPDTGPAAPGGTGDLFTEGQPNPPAPPAPGPPGGAGPNLPPAAQVPDLPNYRNAASFITAQVGDPAIERDVQIILAGRMNRDRNPIEAENAIAAHPEVDRIQAMMSLVERARGKGSAWDPQLAQENLRRYVSGDPTLPANALGSQVRMDVVDKRPGVVIRLGPNAQQPTRSVTGTVTEVSRVQGQRGMVYVRLRAVDGSDHFERVPADMRLDVLQPVDQNGPLAGAVRDVRSSLINVVGISAADRMYYAAQVQGLSGGNIPADDAHARVDDIRNSVINTTDGGERTGVMNALDRLDMAIDDHAGAAPGPEPVAPQGETVRARELSVGDQISYDTPEGTISGEIEGMHTAAANTVVTLRHPDDTRSTRAFGPDATVQRLQAADPPTQYVAARDLRAGERIIVPDATGAYRPATILAQRRDLGGTGLTMEIVRDNGDHETLTVDPSEALPRVTAGDVAPEPDLPPITPDPQPEDGTKFARDLQPGDRIASYGDTITVVRSRVSPDGQTVTARIRLASGTEDDATFGADAVLPLVDPPNTVDVAALAADAPSARPVLYTYQRKNIVALNLDDPNHPASSPVVAQAAARVRNRQPLTEEQSAALADALRAQASAPGVRAPRQRSLQRQAYALDAAAATAAGRQPPAMPNRDRVEKTRPGNLVEGDWIAVRGQGAGGGIDVLQVLGKRPMMGGRLHELTVRDQDGNESRRLVAGNSDTYLLPDLPRDLPAPPPAPEQPRLEHVAADRIAVGDTIRIPVTDQNYNTEMRDARVTDIRREPRGEGLGFNTRFATDQPGPDGGPYWFAVGVASGPTTLRVSRGPGSQEQPYDSLLPAENPEPIRDIRDLQVGDRITIPAKFGAPTTGVIHEVDPGKDERGKDAVILSIREDNGQMTGSFLSQGDTVTRLSKGDAGAAARLLAEKVERERQQQVALIADRLTHVRATMIMSMSRRARLRAGRFQPTELSQAIIQARVPDRGADEATPLAQRLSGGDNTLATALAPRLQEIISQMRQEESDRMLQSLREVRPDPGQADSAAAIRVLEQWESSPPSRDMTAIATTLHQALAAVRGDEGTSADTTLNIPEGADLRTRIAAYREAIGGSGEGFGKKHVTRTLFKPTTLDDLEAGRVPETEQVSAYIPDRAPDDGPGEVAMAHHDVIVAAGRELDAELQRRIAARDSGLGSDPEATITTLADEKAAAYQAFRDAVSVRIEAHSAAERAALEGTGFTDRFTLHRAQRQAHWDGGPGAAAEEERLKALEEQVNRDIARGTREAQVAEDAAHERSRQVDERYYTMVKRLARIRREVAMEILAEHRQTGGVRMDWINPSKRTVLTERSELVKAMRGAEDVYPTDWLQRFKDRTGGRYNLKSVKRGHFKAGIEVALSTKAVKMEGGSNKDDVAVHELGHAMEWVVPGLVAAEAALLWARTSEGPVGSRTRQKQSRIYNKEYGYKDDFPEHYTGKDYGGQFYEVFTTSVESVFAGSSYTDENLRHWLLGTMALI